MDKSAKYGYFSPDGKEYIITRPDTPRPWINYLTNGKFTSLCSATGGGFSFYIDPSFNRITRGIPGETTLSDRPGRYLYVRDNDSGEYWSVNWQPVMKEADFWEARIGLGYNKISSINSQIQIDVTYFVPLDDNLEVWDIKVKNLSEKKRNISIISYVEWVLGGFSKDLTDRNFDSFFNDVYFKNNVIYATKRRWDNPTKRTAIWPYWAYLTGSVKFECFDCVKQDFIGEYRYLSNPIVVEKGFCRNGYGESEEAIGALMKILELEKGEEVSFHLVLGIEEDIEAVNKKVKKVTKRSFVEESFKAVQKFWGAYLEKLVVKTPEQNFNLSVNVWNKYQSWVTAQMGEMISLYIGSGSWGFRDECQHVLGVMPIDQKLVEEKLVELLEHQYSDGKTAHAWNPLTNEVYVTDHSDDPQWLVLAVTHFLKETGNLKFLRKKVNYQDAGEGTILEHVLRALDYTLYHVSPNGVPLRRTADWNDALAGGHLGKGESLMVANQVAFNILEIVPILEKIGSRTKARRYLNIYEHLKKTINEQYWDGKWYVRATDDAGNLIGTKRNKEGKIHINGQTWPVMSRVAAGPRAEIAMDSLWKHLMTTYGALTFAPAYTKLNSALGVVSQFAPGTKENSTIFSHPNAWAIIAECILGRGDKAYEVWQRTSFLTRSHEPDVFLVEPYVYPEFSYGPQSPHFGQGSYSWMTGSASWFFKACTEYILGIRPTLSGLLIDPCIPKTWDSFEVKRNFRGATFNIKVKNPQQVSNGVKFIKVGGKEINGNLLPDFKSGEHKVEVLMGS
ncbi:MAG TPA: glycosyl transferase family 36 [Candidatus Nanoarchaeia archaeon]|nr:cellobiose phosphorylase [uncultured archaeon]